MSDARQILVIYDISGRQGGSVAQAFLPMGGCRVRGLIRGPDDHAARYWAAHGAEIIRIDPYDEAAMEDAFKGAFIIFASTDFEHHLADHSTQSLAYMTKEFPAKIASVCELREARTIVRAAANTRSLRRLIFSVAPDVEGRSMESIIEAHHLNAKAEIVKVIKQEYPGLALKTAFLQVGCFMQDYRKLVHSNSDGSFTISSTVSGDTRIPWLHPQADIGTYIKPLIGTLPAGTTLAAESEALSFNEICALFTKVSGKPMAYHQYTPNEMERVVPGYGHHLDAMWRFIEQFGFFDDNVLSKLQVLERWTVIIPTSTFENFLREEMAFQR